MYGVNILRTSSIGLTHHHPLSYIAHLALARLQHPIASSRSGGGGYVQRAANSIPPYLLGSRLTSVCAYCGAFQVLCPGASIACLLNSHTMAMVQSYCSSVDWSSAVMKSIEIVTSLQSISPTF